MVARDEDRGRIYELAHEEAARALVEQQAAIDNLRTRAGVLISAAAVATSFLGGQALRTGFGLASLVAVAAFAGVAVASVLVLWPTEEIGPAASSARIIELYADAKDPPPVFVVHREMAYKREAIRDANERLRQVLIRRFRTASACLGLEVAGWLVDLVVSS